MRLKVQFAVVLIAVVTAWGISVSLAQFRIQVAAPGIGAKGDPADPKDGPTSTSVAVNRNLSRDLSRAQERIATDDFGPAIEFLQERIIDRPEDFFLDQELQGTIKGTARSLLLAMTPDQRKFYDLRYAANARQILDAAKTAQDLNGMAEAARRYFVTESGAEAAYLLGSASLDRGRPLEAAKQFGQVSLLWAGRWEPTLSLKTALAWRLAGFDDKAREALIAGKKRAPNARFDLGERGASWFESDDGALAWLDQLAKTKFRATRRSGEEEEWTTPRGAASRNGSAFEVSPLWRPLWKAATLSHEEAADAASTKRAAAELSRIRESYEGTSFLTIPAASPIAAVDVAPPVIPRKLVDEAPSGTLDVVVFRTLANVRAVHLATGRTLWESIQVDPTYEKIVEGDLANAAGNGQPQGTPLQNLLTQRAFRDLTAGALSTDGERVYSVEDVGFISPFNQMMAFRGVQNTIGASDSNRLVAAELNTGRLLWEVGGPRTTRELPLAGTFFLGPPLALNGQLYILGENGGEVSLYVLEAATGNIVWTQSLVVPELSLEILPQRRLVGLTPAESNGILLCPTDGGAVMAIDLERRQLLWGMRYGTNTPSLNTNPAMRFQLMNMARSGHNGPDDETRWLDSTPVVSDGYAILTPRDSEEMLCVRLLDGSLVWKQPRGQFLYVAAIQDRKAIVVGRSQVEAFHLDRFEKAAGDDAPSPVSAWQEPTPISMPSGRGVRCGGMYHLPLSTREIATLDLNSGRLVARSKTPDGVMPGNLIAIRGSLISQSVDSISALEGLEGVEAKIEESLKNDPRDAEALALKGELELHRGQTAAALANLRESVKSNPRSPARAVLAETLLEGLRHDFAAHRGFSDEIESLIDDPQQRASFLRLTAAGLAKVGERRAAFQQYLKLLSPDAASPTLERLSGDLSVRSDRWGRARLAEIVASGGEEDRKAMDETVQTQLNGILAKDDLAQLRGFVGTFGELPLADQARRRMCELLDPKKDGLALEFLLLRLRESKEPELAAFATAQLLELYLDRECHQPVPRLLNELEQTYGDVIAKEGKLGRELAEQWKSDDNVLQLLAGPAAWPDRNLEVKKAGRRGNVEQEFPIEVVGPRGVFDGWRLFVDARRQGIVARDGAGQDRWTLRVDAMKDPRRPNDPPKVIPNIFGNSVRVHGHQMVLTLGSYFVVLDTLVPGAAPHVLWIRDLQDNVGLTANPYGIQPRQIVLPNGMRKMEIVDVMQRPLGTVGVVNEDYLAYQVGTTLVAADPLTGDVLWERKNITRGSEIFGDREFVFVVAPGSQQVMVLRSTDGEAIGVKTLPTHEARLSTNGRHVVAWQKVGDGVELSVVDASTGRRLWQRPFAKEARSMIIEDEEIAVFDGAGRFSILQLSNGAARLEADLGKIEDLENIHVFRSTDRYVLLTARPAAAAGRRVQMFNNFNKTMLVNGPAWGFHRETGKTLWAAQVEHQQIELNQPENLPVLFFSALRFNLQNGGQFRGAQEWAVLALDVRNGRTIYTDASPSNTIPYRLRVDATKKTISVDFYNSSLEISVTDSPLLPGEIPAKAATP